MPTDSRRAFHSFRWPATRAAPSCGVEVPTSRPGCTSSLPRLASPRTARTRGSIRRSAASAAVSPGCHDVTRRLRRRRWSWVAIGRAMMSVPPLAWKPIRIRNSFSGRIVCERAAGEKSAGAAQAAPPRRKRRWRAAAMVFASMHHSRARITTPRERRQRQAAATPAGRTGRPSSTARHACRSRRCGLRRAPRSGRRRARSTGGGR